MPWNLASAAGSGFPSMRVGVADAAAGQIVDPAGQLRDRGVVLLDRGPLLDEEHLRVRSPLVEEADHLVEGLAEQREVVGVGAVALEVVVDAVDEDHVRHEGPRVEELPGLVDQVVHV